MTDAPPPAPLDALLRHHDWVRALARRLVADPNLADDIEQETWLEALRRPPRHATSARGWLGTVARNAARKLGRSATRRERHETAAPPARSRDLPAADLAAELEVGRRLVELVLALDEPYRSAVLLRWFEGLAPAAIAQRLGVPVETVRTRLKRATATLRDRMDERHRGDRAAWALVLVGPRRPRVGIVGLGKGIAMGAAKKLAFAAAALLLLAGGVAWFASPAARVAPPERSMAAAPAHAAMRRVARNAPTEPAAANPTAATGPVLAKVEELRARDAPKPAGTETLAGRVVAGANPVAGAEIRLRFVDPKAAPPHDDWFQGNPRPTVGPVAATTDADGKFLATALRAGRYDVQVIAPGFEWWTGKIDVPGDALGVELLRLGVLTGRVRLADGTPVVGAPVSVEQQSVYRGATTTDAEGRFRFDDVPSRGLTVWVLHAFDGTGPNIRQFQVKGWKHAGDDLDIVVEAGLAIAGRIVDAAGGAPPRQAIVRATLEGQSFAAEGATLNADGTFAVFGLAPGRYRVTTEISNQPGETTHQCAPVEAIDAGTQGLVLVATSGLAIEGVAEIPDGEKSAIGGYVAARRPGVRGMDANRERGTLGDLDASGRFRIKGLAPGRYRIVFLEPTLCDSPWQAGDAAFVDAGATDVRLVLATSSTISGRVTFDGQPVQGANVVARAVGEPKDECATISWTRGEFTFVGLDPTRRWNVAAYREKTAPARATNLAIGAADLDLTLSPGLPIRGRVLRADGSPAASVYVMFANAAGDWGGSARTDEKGDFEVLGLDAGEYVAKARIAAATAGGASEDVEIGAVRAGDEHVALRLPR